MRPLLAPLLCLLPLAALARESHSVTVVNGSSDVVREIRITPAGAAAAGENRLRSQLPPNTEARITHSTGCQVDVRVTFQSGRAEERRGVDACTDPRLTVGSGTGTVAAALPRPAPAATGPKPAAASEYSVPWTGRSITKRFGGLTDEGAR